MAYGLPAFEAGRWGTLLLGPLFGLTPAYTVVGIIAFALLAGFAEWRLGTARTVVIAIGFQLLTVLVTAALLWLLRGIGWAWATSVAAELDVGFSGGLLAITAVATATLPAPWKLRARLALVGAVLLMVALVGQLADLEHLVAVTLSLPFAARLAGPRAVAGVTRPSRREQRWIVAAGLVIVAVAQVVVHVIPDRLTPFGPAQHTGLDMGHRRGRAGHRRARRAAAAARPALGVVAGRGRGGTAGRGRRVRARRDGRGAGRDPRGRGRGWGRAAAGVGRRVARVPGRACW